MQLATQSPLGRTTHARGERPQNSPVSRDTTPFIPAPEPDRERKRLAEESGVSEAAAWDAWLDCKDVRAIADELGVGKSTVDDWVSEKRESADPGQAPTRARAACKSVKMTEKLRPHPPRAHEKKDKGLQSLQSLRNRRTTHARTGR